MIKENVCPAQYSQSVLTDGSLTLTNLGFFDIKVGLSTSVKIGLLASLKGL